MTKTTDPNGHVFETTYDGFGRPLTETGPDPDTGAPVLKTEYTYTDTPGDVSVQKRSHLNSSLAHDSYTYFDGFGRTIQERTEGESEYAVRDFVYGPNGLLASESLPYFAAGAGKSSSTALANLYTTYTYDALGRTTNASTVVGNTSTVYDDWTTTVTDANGNDKGQEYDAYGRLVAIEEHDGGNTYTTAYQWSADDNLTKITDANGNERSITYDGLSRRTTLEDLHDPADTTFGTWHFTYDDVGNLLTQVDPENQTIAYTYDNVNRLLTEDFTGDVGIESTYVYDNCLNGIGQLCMVSNDAVTTASTYDEAGNMASETKTIDSIDYTTSYGYDQLGNQTAITYPDGSEVQNTYNAAGQLESVEQRESGGVFADVITDIDYAPHGAMTQMVHANNRMTTRTYDADELYRLRNITTITPGTGGPGAEHAEIEALLTFGLPITQSAVEAEDVTIVATIPNTTSEAVTEEVILVADQATSSSVASTSDDTSTNTVELELEADPTTSTTTSTTSVEVASTTVATTSVSLASTTPSLAFSFDPPPMAMMSSSSTDDDIRKQDLLDIAAALNTYYSQHGTYVVAGSAYNGTGNGWFSYTCLSTGCSIYQLSVAEALHAEGHADRIISDPTGVTNSSAPLDQSGYMIYITGSPSNGTQAYTLWANLDNPTPADLATLDACTASNYDNYSSTYNPERQLNYCISGDQPTPLSDDDTRKQDLQDIATALDSYYDQNDTYAVTGSGANGNSNGWFSYDCAATGCSNYPLSVAEALHTGGYANRFIVDPTGVENTDAALDQSGYMIRIEGNPTSGTQTYTLWANLDDPTATDIATMDTCAESHYDNYSSSFPSSRQMNYCISGDRSDVTGAVTAVDLTYTYDAVGNITQIVDASDLHAQTTTYVYDDLYRLIDSTNVPVNGAGYSRTYAYDPLGNILNKSDQGAYAYAGNQGVSYANPHAVTDVAGVTHAYDNNGNLDSTSAGLSNTWTYRNELAQSIEGATTVNYSYDHTGQRVKKTTGSSTTLYPSSLYEIADGTPKKQIYAGDQLAATVEGSGSAASTYHNHLDHLNSTSIVTDDTGMIDQSLTYYPFGSTHTDQQYGSHDQTNRFTGHDYDEETELSYMGARYQSGEVGRFISQDPVSLALGDWETVQDKTDGKLGFYLSNPQSHNSYSYAANNPIKYVDKNGEFFWFPAIVVGAIVVDQLMSATVLTDDANINAPTQNSSLPELALQDAGVNSTAVMVAGLAGDAYGASKGNFRSVQDIVGSAKNVFTTRHGTTFGEKGGGFDATKNDFYSIDGISNVKVRDKGKLITGEVDGNTVTARSYSREGRPTLQINNKEGGKTEIRYNKKKDE